MTDTLHSTSESSPTSTSRAHQWFTRTAERLAGLSHWQLVAILWASSLAMCLLLLGSSRTTITGTMNIVENWGAVERVALWQDFLEPVLPRFTLPTGVIAWGFRAAMLAAFVAQVSAFVVVMKLPNPSMARWLIGPLGAHIIMTMFMVPSNSDIFFYEAVGDLAANGINPFVSELMDYPDHPLIPYNYWIDIGTVYGPHWVNYNRIVMGIVGPDPIAATLVQKALAGLATFLLAGLVFWFAKRLSGGNQTLAVAAGVLVAWQPNMIIESSGQIHNDPHTVLIATAGLALAIFGGLKGLRGGILLVAVSIMIKFVTLPLLGILGIIRIIERKKPHGIGRILGNWIFDGIGILAVIVGAFLPYWEGFETIEEMLAEPSRLYTHPLWRFIQSSLGFFFPDSVSGGWTAVSRPFLQVASIAMIIGIVVWLGRKLWNAPQTNAIHDVDAPDEDGLPWWTRHVLYSWMFMFFVLSFVPVNSHPWYWVWPITAVSLVVAFDMKDGVATWTISRMPTWFWVYMWGNAILTIMYHTRIARY